MTGLLNATEAAKYININRSTLWKWVKNGKIKPVEITASVKLYKIKDLKRLKPDSLKKP